MKDKRDLVIEKQRELIEHYQKEIERTAVYLHVQNMSCSVETSEKGARLNKELTALQGEQEQLEREDTILTDKCEACGNTTIKELHCGECGNNFPYFSPATPQPEPKEVSAEEILHKHLNNIYIFPNEVSDEELNNVREGVYKAMQEYAEQFSNSKTISDEDIKKQGMIEEGVGDRYVEGMHYSSDWIDGAKWYREQLKK